MARGHNILFNPPILKKEADRSPVQKRFFPSKPTRAIRHSRGFFIVGEDDYLYSYENGQKRFVYRTPLEGFGEGKATLTSSGAIWLDGEDICYRYLYPDLALETQILPPSGGDPLALHLATGNRAYLVQEENRAGETVANFKYLRIDPRGGGAWENYFPAEWFEIDAFDIFENEGWLFYKAKEGEKRVQYLDLCPNDSRIKRWQLSDLNESFYYKSPRLLAYNDGEEDKALWSRDDTLLALRLNEGILRPNEGESEVILTMPGRIKDFSRVEDDLIFFLEDGTLWRYNLLHKRKEEIAALDVDTGELLLAGQDIMLLSDDKEYYYLPSLG